MSNPPSIPTVKKARGKKRTSDDSSSAPDFKEPLPKKARVETEDPIQEVHEDIRVPEEVIVVDEIDEVEGPSGGRQDVEPAPPGAPKKATHVPPPSLTRAHVKKNLLPLLNAVADLIDLTKE